MTARKIPAAASAVAGVLAALIVLTGCTGDTGSEPTPEPSASVNGLPPGVSSPTDVPTDVANDPKARLNVAIAECEATETGWRAGGTVVNSAEEDATYQITVFFTTDSGTVVQYGSTEVPVAATETVEWRIESDFVAPDQTLCALRGAAVQ